VTLGGYSLAPGPEWTEQAFTWLIQAAVRQTEPGHVLTAARHLDRAGQPFTQVHLVCAECDQSVICLTPDLDRPGYVLDVALIQAGVLRHIRECHESIVTV
jgi:hypothetical protein